MFVRVGINVVHAGLELTFVAQAGLELAPILLPQPPKCWDYLFIFILFSSFCFIYSFVSTAG